MNNSKSQNMDRLPCIIEDTDSVPDLCRQSGAALLILLLLMTGAGTLLLLNNLKPGLMLMAREYRTVISLQQARDALIGYAISYPDKINPDFGPGYLPCPDRNNDGATDAGACSLSGHTSIGRLPYKTLELERMQDAQGETLWYVVGDHFRNNPKLEPLNSDTSGDLVVDGQNDIAAIVLAPGAPVSAQNRVSGINDAGNYLEDENADFDVDFTASSNSVAINDRLTWITRQELMQAVERRVLGEVARRLRQYQKAYHAFPWLSPFSNPAISTFRAQLDTETVPKKGWQGHVAFHPFNWTTKTSKSSGINPFLTDIQWTWTNISNAVINSSGTVHESCLMNLDCDQGPFQEISMLTSPTPIQCIWTDRESVDCAPTSITQSISYTYPPASGCDAGLLVRTYTINFPPFKGVVSVHDPKTTAYRSRSIALNGSLPVRTDALQITDLYSGPVSLYCDQGSVITGSGAMSFTADTTGMIRAGGIHYDLDIKAGEMPEWFFKNDWHTLVYIAYADAESLPGSAENVCKTEENCLVLNGAGHPNNRNRALAMIAGRALSGTIRPSEQLSDYYESFNAISDGIFYQSASAPSFNDQLKVIATP